ncbi:MAG TPA: DUF2207 domain-containing protein [Candidatus Omnitrophota bacterium]|nr:DUF2207 domain-containing protein [Candidatus Omnitrophota bacterium]
MKKTLYPAIILLLALFGTIQPAFARNAVLRFNNVDISINDDTSINVHEEKELHYNGDYRIGYRLIDMTGIDQVSDVRLQEGEVEYVESPQDAKYHFQQIDSNGYRIIKWRYLNEGGPAPMESVRRISLDYLVKGAIRYGDGFDYLSWKVLSDTRQGEIEKLTVRVHFPQDVDKNRVSAAVESSADNTSWKVTGSRTIEFSGENITTGEAFNIKVYFPVGIVERVVSYNRLKLPLYTAFVLPAITLFFMIFLYFRLGREYEMSRIKNVLKERPSDLSPALAGTLTDEIARVKEVLAALIDLARRGYIMITEVPDDYEFKLVKTSENLADFEKRTLKVIFGSYGSVGRTVLLSSFGKRFAPFVVDIEEAIYEEAVRLGYFTDNPSFLRRLYNLGGWTVSIFGLVGLWFINLRMMLLLAWILAFAGIPGYLFFDVLRKKQTWLGIILLAFVIFGIMAGIPAVTQQLMEQQDSLLLMLAVGITLSGAILVILSGAVPNKSLLGSNEKAKWLAFKKYLHLPEAAAEAEDYLPYAIAFGLASQYLEMVPEDALRKMEWYRPLSHPKTTGATGSFSKLLSDITSALFILETE